MKILLPPSEGKAAAVAGEPVELGDLSFAFLSDARERVADVLAEVSASEGAFDVLKVGASLGAEVERNTRVWEEPTWEVWRVYTGVLFEALDVGSLSAQEFERAVESIVVVSALWGAVRLDDVIPAYRLSMGVKLPGVGSLATFWEAELGRLNELMSDELFVDCRSAAYAKAWVTPAVKTVQVRVEKLLADGSRKVVSHMAKHYRGELARFLVTENLTHIAEPRQLFDAVQRRWQAELVEPTEKKPGVLTLIIPEG
ncbi:YaaA family protein [Rothia terrae]|uniref:YaaA family protein n=1 Tax=Rothia terrae TaxID=396015 RepID=UPI002882ACA4|nr:peroxide stress protein YaaA [Rothia terrae]MDT0188946.1 peroxide stress protein YaaA [Rothia terrae]